MLPRRPGQMGWPTLVLTFFFSLVFPSCFLHKKLLMFFMYLNIEKPISNLNKNISENCSLCIQKKGSCMYRKFSVYFKIPSVH